MRTVKNINSGWNFELEGKKSKVNLPHTWNGKDGQDGGGDYLRTTGKYTKKLGKISIGENELAYLEFKGVNSSAKVVLNGKEAASHDGGYSKFRVNITEFLNDENLLEVYADNSVTEKVYPQTADFTFYGGIYRDVNLITVNKNHFELDYYGTPGIKITPVSCGNGSYVKCDAYIYGEGEVKIEISDAAGNKVAEGKNNEEIKIPNPHLWDGLKDPYLYTARATLTVSGEVADEISYNFGFRSFEITKDGFFLNGRSYPLRGVCRHQDRPDIGNAITKEMHEEDIKLILDIGANTIRLAHYQHDDYFYDLCDKYGLVIWAEIPYISRHMPEANDNAVSQMTELIVQQYNHPSIVVWGLSNEITMFNRHKKDMLKEHEVLNALSHKLDPTRPTTVACFSMCTPFDKVSHIPDVVSWNLYFGWYVPFLWINDVWFGFFRLLYPKLVIGLSEYGAECMPAFHSLKPKIGDNTEEYQCIYHEYMAKFIERTPYLWATHIWNMFDFASDGRNQGGEPGMNHKGLVTFDRKTKKDAFYVYKAYWSDEPFIHIAGKRFEKRTGNKLKLKVYSNQKELELFVNGQPAEKKTGSRVFTFTVPFNGQTDIEVKCGNISDKAHFERTEKPEESYIMHVKSQTHSWEKKK